MQVGSFPDKINNHHHEPRTISRNYQFLNLPTVPGLSKSCLSTWCVNSYAIYGILWLFASGIFAAANSLAALQFQK
jgi:hypothetical protein